MNAEEKKELYYTLKNDSSEILASQTLYAMCIIHDYLGDLTKKQIRIIIKKCYHVYDDRKPRFVYFDKVVQIIASQIQEKQFTIEELEHMDSYDLTDLVERKCLI